MWILFFSVVTLFEYNVNNFVADCSFILYVIIHITVHQISGQRFSRVLISSRNSNYHWIFTVLGRGIENGFSSKDEILEVHEAAAPTNTKIETKSGLSAFTGRWGHNQFYDNVPFAILFFFFLCTRSFKQPCTN